uniref:Adenosine 3'-phospho 5'-phosphosulfate transporter 1 n=1 Tax=Macrostomum lignano TaxID=282301 RepID=A0A1I8FAP9_9PLAT
TAGGWAAFWANLIGYGSVVLLPLGGVVQLAQVWDYESRGPRRSQQGCAGGCLAWLIRLLSVGAEPQSDLEAELGKAAAERKPERRLNSSRTAGSGRLSNLGRASRERMVTADYGHAGNASVTRSSWCSPTGCFPACWLWWRSALSAGRRIGAPAFEYTWSSLSNVLSSWCQYEALLYVSFPTQVLAKACQNYTSDADGKTGVKEAPAHFYSPPNRMSTQLVLFTRHGVTTLQMMAGTSVLSCVLTLEQGSLPAAVAFACRHPQFLMHLGLLSVCSTIGQLVIFQTIARFGSVTFIIIMTVRQAFAILLSCLIYQHRVPPLGYLARLPLFFWLCFLELPGPANATAAQDWPTFWLRCCFRITF